MAARKNVGLAAALAVLFCGAGLLSAQQRNVAVLPPRSLAAVKWAGPRIALERLRDKTVVLLVYATWCPKSNVWSGELFGQLKQAIKGRPVVVLAINADKSPAGVKRYLAQRRFFAPNILHGYDPTIPGRLGFRSNLYNYVVIGPDGKVVKKGFAGDRYLTPQGKRFVLPVDLAESKNLGKFNMLTPELSEPVQQLLWPMELGSGSETFLRKARRNLNAEQKKELGAAILHFLDAQWQTIGELSEGEMPDRILAYQKASVLATMFKSTTQSKEAKEMVAELSKDRQFKRELAAKVAYERSMQLAAANPARRNKLLRAVAKRFKDTYYGRLAEEPVAAPP